MSASKREIKSFHGQNLPKTPRNMLINELDQMLAFQTEKKSIPNTPKPASKLELPQVNFDIEEKEAIETVESILDSSQQGVPKLITSQLRTLKYQLKSLFTAQKLERVNLIQAYDKVSMTLSMKEMSQTKRDENIKEQENHLKQKEEDLSQEIQALLGTIDDHKKLNEKINKHFKKRLAELEMDCQKMLKSDSKDLKSQVGCMQVKIRDFLETQVRHKDPLDGHDHLIASSRQVSTRYNNQYQFGFTNRNGDQTQRTVDKGFIQSTARSNIQGLPSGRMTIRTNNGFGAPPRLCDTCLSEEEEFSLLYSEYERDSKIDDKFKGMTLQDKEKLLMQQLMQKQTSEGSLDVKTEDVLGSQTSEMNLVDNADLKHKPSMHKTSKGFSLGSARQPVEMTFFNNTQSINKVAKTSRPQVMMIDDNNSNPETDSSKCNGSSFKNESIAVPQNEANLFDDLNQLSAIKEDQSHDDLLMLSQDFVTNNHGQSSFQASFVFTSINECEQPKQIAKVINTAGNQLIKIPALNLTKIVGSNKDYYQNNVKTQDDDANSSSISFSEDKSNMGENTPVAGGTPQKDLIMNIQVDLPKENKQEEKKFFDVPAQSDPQEINFTLGQPVKDIVVLEEQKPNFYQPISPEDSRNLSKTTASLVLQESSQASMIQENPIPDDMNQVFKKHNIVNKYRQILYSKKHEKPETQEFSLKNATYSSAIIDKDQKSMFYSNDRGDKAGFPPLNTSKENITSVKEQETQDKKKKFQNPKLLGQRGFKRTASAKRKGGPITANIFGHSLTPKAEPGNHTKPRIYQTQRGQDEKENKRKENNFKLQGELFFQDIKFDASDKLSLLKKLTRNANLKNSMKDFKRDNSAVISHKQISKPLNQTTLNDETTICRSFRDVSADNTKGSLVTRSRYKMIKKMGGF